MTVSPKKRRHTQETHGEPEPGSPAGTGANFRSALLSSPRHGKASISTSSTVIGGTSVSAA